MNTRDLKYLVAVAEHQHFGKAAEACFVSQPALSIQIKKLEETLGVKLIERNNKSMLLTDDGYAIVERARHILNGVDELHEYARQASDPFSGELKLGIFPTLAPYLLPLIFPAVSKSLPNASFYLLEEQTTHLISKLKSGEIDAALLALPVNEKNMVTTSLFDEEFLLATNSHHPLAKKKHVTQHDLDDQELLLLEQGHCLRDQALDLCYKLKARETQNFRATSLETLRHMVATGVGMTLMPTLACDNNRNIAYIPFAKPKPFRTIGLISRATSARRPLLDKMTQQISAIMRKHKRVIVTG